MATRQELQLATLNQEYSRFVKDQVLTELQLNEIIDVFEKQHRLTRTTLVGTGIACGLQLKRDANAITLSAGVAVTTDGDLFGMPFTSYTAFVPYTPPDEGHYDPFYYNVNGKEKMVTLFQLLTDEDKSALQSATPVSVRTLDGSISNWVGLLYLEYYLKKPLKCTPTNCDQMGQRQVSKPKLLIVSREDVDKIIYKDASELIGDSLYLKYHAASEKLFSLPVLRVPRVILNSESTQSATALATAYYSVVEKEGRRLCDAIGQLFSAFRYWLDPTGSVTLDLLTTSLLETLKARPNRLYAQYAYDYYKDIVKACNELRELLHNLVAECRPDVYAFPKHIMLGEPDIEVNSKPPAWRHQFYPSPTITKNQSQVAEAVGQFRRLKLLIENFSPVTAEEIRITPSGDYSQPLSERAIPCYFGNAAMLFREWNFGLKLRGQERMNLSYHSGQYRQPAETDDPLDYDLDAYRFFRIEGHIGLPYAKALKMVEQIRVNKGLPFDVVGVRLGDPRLSDIDLAEYTCLFEDLETMLQAFRAETACLLAESSRFFSGFTANKEKPHINLQLYQVKEQQPRWNINADLLRVVDKKSTSSKETTILSESETGTTEALKPSQEKISRFARTTTKVVQAVKGSLDLNELAFGTYFLQALEASPASADDFAEKARNLVISANLFKDMSEDERCIVFEYPMQIVGNLNFAQHLIPSTIAEVTDTVIAEFREFTRTFCIKIKVMRTRVEDYFSLSAYKAKGYEAVYMNMLDRLGQLCCGNEKLRVILDEVAQRKTDILSRLTLADYIGQHPGLEHKAGVYRGGTFVLVHAVSEQVAGNMPVTKPGDIVIADFCLPYLCRSNCPPVAFIMPAEPRPSEEPEPKKELALPVKVACSTQTPIAFSVYAPAGAVITSPEAPDAVVSGTKPEFNPAKVPDNAIGKPVTFRLDGQETGCTIIVSKPLTVAVAFTITENTESGFTVTFQNSTDETRSGKNDYLWEFGAAKRAMTVNGTGPLPVTFERARLKESGLEKIDIKVTVSGDPCVSCKTLVVSVPLPPKKELALPVKVACSTQTPIAFSVYAPAGAVITSPEAPDAIVSGTKPAFNPAKVPDNALGKPVTFRLDGQETGCTITVTKPLTVAVAFTITENTESAFTVTFQNSTDETRSGKNAYLWEFGAAARAKTVKGTGALPVTFERARLKESGLDKIDVMVTVPGDPCASFKAFVVSVPSAPVQPSVDQCKAVVLDFLANASKTLSTVSYQRTLKAAGSTELSSISQGTISLLAMAQGAQGDAAVTEKIVLTSDGLIRQLYVLKTDPTTPNVARVAEALLRVLLMLMLNMVRCDRQILTNSKSAILRNLLMFEERGETLKKQYPQLDLQNVLESAVSEYATSFTSKDPDLLKMVARIKNILSQFPASA
ncbi:MAG: hypothetical protein HGA97_00805 [Chlorobiaceae bacterium]|nr:hypothetical protein [Chlorobiaceae bacterium]